MFILSIMTQRLNGEGAFAEVGGEQGCVGDVCAHFVEVLCEDPLHLALHIGLCRIHVVELLLPRCASVGAVDGVERLADVYGQGFLCYVVASSP